MDQGISVLSDDNIKQLRRLKEVLEKHSYKTETLKGINTSILWLPSTLYKLKEDTPQNILIRLFFIGKTVSEFEIAKVFNSDERFAFIRLGMLEKVDSKKWESLYKIISLQRVCIFCFAISTLRVGK